MTKEMTNEEFARTDKQFQAACAKAGLPKTAVHKRGGSTVSATVSSLARQAGKWRKGKGLAFANRKPENKGETENAE